MLFACAMNSVRSPMAAGIFKHFFARTYVKSAGVRKGEPDGFAVSAMDELGLDIAKHKPMTFEELEDWEGLNFDLIVTLSPEAHHQALEMTRTMAVDVEYWPTFDASIMQEQGGREQILESYRAVRDRLFKRVKDRFALEGGPSV